MATLLRPPLVFGAHGRKPIGTPEVPQRPLTLIPQPAIPKFLQLTDSAPRVRFRTTVDRYPNLSVSTLGLVPPDTTNVPIVQVYGSAPQRTPRLSVDVYPNLLATTLQVLPVFGLPLRSEILDDSAPARKRSVGVDPYPNLLASTLKPDTNFGLPLRAEIMDDSAPARRARLQVDDYPNLLVTTLAAPPAVFGLPLSALRLEGSIPQTKRSYPDVQQPPRRVWADAVPAFRQLNQSAPWVRFRTQVDVYPNITVLGINPNAKPLQLNDSAPRTKRPVYVDVFPNVTLLVTGEQGVVPPEPPSTDVGRIQISMVDEQIMIRMLSDRITIRMRKN